MNILFLDACVRVESRTRRLAKALLEKLDGDITELDLYREDIRPLDLETLEKREAFIEKGIFEDDMFKYARMVKEADTIVLAAPFWDLSFPSVVKVFIEAVSVRGFTFKYSEEGYPIGLCKGKKLYLVMTAGGPADEYDHSYPYIRDMFCGMFGIDEIKRIVVDNLDILGNDSGKMLGEAIKGLEI